MTNERERNQQDHRYDCNRSSSNSWRPRRLLESVYEEALAYEPKQSGCEVKRQTQTHIHYKDVTLSTPLRINFVVNDLVIVESKAVSQYNAISATRVPTYLRLRNLMLGRLINFDEHLVKMAFIMS
ncbi:GxxExxY protein [Rubripirellula reticaptiva]|uniref:GxxExxY protein n=1 Tax=Rubripirellula reticaptiva TaxID=2528013 RepID=UPI001FE56867|nr:GxxExxY protein [Rubripirellula reticaptiva]